MAVITIALAGGGVGGGEGGGDAIMAISDDPQQGLLQHVAFAQTIENDRHYTGDDGSLHIVGEIVNDLKVPLRGASVQATIYDGDGNVVLTSDADSLVNVIMPGMRGPFDIMLENGGQIPKEVVGRGDSASHLPYALKLDYDFADPKRQVIDVTGSEITRDRHKNLIITGTVANGGEITANMISIVATIYDDTGSVAAVTRVHTEPDYLRAGESAFFVVSVPDKEHAADATRYHLVAESEEYAAVPEFPIGTVLLLAGTFSAYVAATRLASSRLPMTGLIAAANPR
ncbi:MAG: FxLYD domain-containing protein [Nitrosopumilaceae archaeon]|nr:FxLYD domain-containing protein [Nitrosopumilaceae archaeon]